jgi:hypothetical protein
MGAAACTALSWALFSTDLCARYAGPVGLSLFLLVSIRVGDRRIRTSGNCLPEAKNLGTDSWQGDGYAALPPSGEKMQRVGSIPSRCMKVGLVLRVVVRSFRKEIAILLLASWAV